MKSIILAALVSAAAVAGAIATAPAAMAQVGVSVDFGDVAIGYRDGYWDGQHHWHHWAHPNDWKAYGHAHPEHYHDYSHKRDHDH